jgi:PAT family acetyl-CoA transporter-like MFS transporter 1
VLSGLTSSPARRRPGPKDVEAAAAAPSDAEPPVAKQASDLQGDWGAIALLLLLYTLQGVPLGLSGSLPMLFQERGVTTMEQAVFSTVAYPFAFKLLWAPLVDSIYIPKFGRRKTWIVPAQAAIGLLLLTSSRYVNGLLGPIGGGGANVRLLTKLFFVFHALAATQDIAVDGLALTVLSERNKELGATCNAIGQTFGFFMAYVGFLALNAYGLTSLGGFMAFWGWLFLASTLWVMAVRKDEFYSPPGSASSQLIAAYKEMLVVLRLPAVRSLALVLLTCKAPLAAFDLLVPLELQASGVPKEMLATLTTLLLPVTMAAQAYVSRGFGASGRSKPMKVFMRAYAGRLVVGAALILLVYCLGATQRDGGAIPTWLYALGTVTSCAAAAASATMFVSQMAFYNRISDPKIGGTYMTMLNTMSNLGGQWPGTLVLATKGAIERLPGKPNGFFGVCMGSLVLGVVWFLLMRRRVSELQAKPKQSWLSSH